MATAWLHQGELNSWEYLGLALALLAALMLRRAPFHLRLPALRPWQAVTITGLAALILRAVLLPMWPVPQPSGHDEFSYLLQADTFAHGRLTNPTHPMWRHFETIHVIQQPTYQSMYPPMQGLLLAAGQILGHPWIGVWLSVGAMCAAITWMLLGYLPSRWALLGGLLAVFHYGVFSYWMNSYWGGAHAAIGGAFVLGSLARLLHSSSHRWRHGLLIGLGFAILANSRPYEGLLFSAGVALSLTWREMADVLRRAFVPALLVLPLAACGMAMYFQSVTGSPLRMPYQVNQETYGWPMTLPWYAPKTIKLHNADMAGYYEWELKYHSQYRSLAGFRKELWSRARILWRFFAGPSLTLPLLMFGRRALSERPMRQLRWPLFIVLVAVLAGQSATPHYLAPVAGIFLVWIVQSLRHLRIWKFRGRETGTLLAEAVLTVPLIAIGLYALHIVPARSNPMSWCCCQEPGFTMRVALLKQLQAMPGGQLVIVSDLTNSGFFHEWVYNAADIDHAKVVWARDLGDNENRGLLNYFPDRTIWRIRPDTGPGKLEILRKPSTPGP